MLHRARDDFNDGSVGAEPGGRVASELLSQFNTFPKQSSIATEASEHGTHETDGA